jgi:peptidoglycan/LPS O-acetylase OafA/YrhL
MAAHFIESEATFDHGSVASHPPSLFAELGMLARAAMVSASPAAASDGDAIAARAPSPKGGEFHIPSLDGIRAVSFMIVFVSHAGLAQLVPGGLGVTIFFFLSGYLITTLLRLERDRTGKNSLRDFYLRRAFRIWPPFYAILTFAVTLTILGVLPEPLRLSSVLAQLCHVTNYWFVMRDSQGFPAGTVVYWSLAVEEHFYLVFPFVFILLRRRFDGRPRMQAGLLIALCALVLLWRFVLVLLLSASPERTSLCSDTRIDSILFGCVLALMGNPMLDAWRGSRSLWTRVLFPAGLLLMVSTLTYRAPWFRETLRYTLQGIALIPFFVVAIRYPEWLPMRALNLKVMRWLGLLSYSLYLCHQVILFAVQNHVLPSAPLSAGVVSFALSVLFAWGVHHLIERPSARARRGWVTTPWLKGAPAAPARGLA